MTRSQRNAYLLNNAIVTMTTTVILVLKLLPLVQKSHSCHRSAQSTTANSQQAPFSAAIASAMPESWIAILNAAETHKDILLIQKNTGQYQTKYAKK